MGRAVGYLKGMPLKGLTYRKPENLRVVYLVDTDFTNCPDTRKLVGYTVTTIGGTMTGGDSVRHDGVSLSSTEVEYWQLVKGASSVKFHQMLLEEVAHTEHPAIILEDNNGAFFLAKNKQVGKRTKHSDIPQNPLTSEPMSATLKGLVYKYDICTAKVKVNATLRTKGAMSVMQFILKHRGVYMISSPRYHEYAWGFAKGHYRHIPLLIKTLDKFKKCLRIVLDSKLITKERCRRFSQRAKRYI